MFSQAARENGRLSIAVIRVLRERKERTLGGLFVILFSALIGLKEHGGFYHQ